MNKVILMGRLTRDPETTYSKGAEPLAVTRYTLAVNRKFKREGEADADFIPCVAFGRTAEFARDYFKKGLMISVVGRIQVSSWTDQNNQKRWSTDVVIEDQYFAESKSSFEASRNSHSNFEDKNMQSQPTQPTQSFSNEPDGFTNVENSVDDDDLPF